VSQGRNGYSKNKYTYVQKLDVYIGEKTEKIEWNTARGKRHHVRTLLSHFQCNVEHRLAYTVYGTCW